MITLGYFEFLFYQKDYVNRPNLSPNRPKFKFTQRHHRMKEVSSSTNVLMFLFISFRGCDLRVPNGFLSHQRDSGLILATLAIF